MKILFIILVLIIIIFAGYITQSKKRTYSVNNSYVACGCGCCGDVKYIEQCIYRSKGDDLSKIIEEDKKSKQGDLCKLAGCNMGTRYVYCD